MNLVKDGDLRVLKTSVVVFGNQLADLSWFQWFVSTKLLLVCVQYRASVSLCYQYGPVQSSNGDVYLIVVFVY